MNDQAFSQLPGRTVGGCRVERQLGAGGMGVVFEARHLALDKRVALKLLAPHLAADQSFVKRFVTEARLAAQVEHPNIVQVLNVGQDGAVYFIVMQFIEGRSLAEILRGGPLPPRDAAKIALQAARGLAAAHARGIIHRDVKPENILIDGGGVARIVDMGLSKNLGAPSDGADTAALTAPGVAMGTPNYISPEQATEARAADARADIYSLGATLFHALAGAPPFAGPSAIAIINQHINTPLVPPSSRRPEVPPELDALVARMMAKNPDERIQTMDEVVTALRKFLGAAGGVTGAAPAAGRTATRRSGAAAPPAAPVKAAVVPATAAVPHAPAAPGKWKFVLIGAAGMLAALVFLGILAAAANPARKAFRAARAYEEANPGDYAGAQERYAEVGRNHPGGEWANRSVEAAAALERRRQADAQAAFDRLAAGAEPLEKSSDWAGAEKLWLDMPAPLRSTDAGEAAGLRATRARVARRTREFFAAMADGRPESIERAATYCDPRQDEKARRFLLGVIVGLVRMGKGTPAELQIDAIEVTPPARALLRGRITITYGALKPPETHPTELHWGLIGEEWFLVDKAQSIDAPAPAGPGPGPKRPRLQDRPERPGRPVPPEAQ
ncbi:MAG TPA: serine/threonine-protein kinase [Planctomycetota bacterium]|nr:serine/threonine-protein kinase [Planctomycetota bacterium]